MDFVQQQNSLNSPKPLKDVKPFFAGAQIDSRQSSRVSFRCFNDTWQVLGNKSWNELERIWPFELHGYDFTHVLGTKVVQVLPESNCSAGPEPETRRIFSR